MAKVVDTTTYSTLLGMDFRAGVMGSIDTWTKTFYYAYEDAAGVTLVDNIRSCAYMVIWRGHRYMCLYNDLTHARVQAFIVMFRFAIERFSYRNKQTSLFLRQSRRHVRKTPL